MKKLLLIVCFAAFGATTFAFGAIISARETPLSFSEVVRVDSVSGRDLFVRGRAWFAVAYKNSKSVLQMAEDCRLIGKAAEVFTINGGFILGDFTVRINYDILVECRDGRYKYVIDNIVASSECGWANFGILTTADSFREKGSGAKKQNEIWLDVKCKFDIFEMLLMQSLKDAMQKGDASTENLDNW